METKIKTESKNPLLKRTEAVVEVLFEGATPKRVDLQKKISEVFKTSADSVSITNVANAFGGGKAVVSANIYKTAEDRTAFERRSIMNKGVPKEKKAEAN